MKKLYIFILPICVFFCTNILLSSCNKYKTVDDDGLCYKKSRQEDPSLTGIVRDSINEGEYLGDVTITISGYKQLTTKTSSSGVYFFDELRPGTYEVVVKKEGYASERLKVQVKNDECMEIVDIKLKPLYTLIVDKFLVEFDVPSNNIQKTLYLSNPFNDASDEDILQMNISASHPWIVLGYDFADIPKKSPKRPLKVSIKSSLLPVGTSSGLITINTLTQGSVIISVTVRK